MQAPAADVCEMPAGTIGEATHASVELPERSRFAQVRLVTCYSCHCTVDFRCKRVKLVSTHSRRTVADVKKTMLLSLRRACLMRCTVFNYIFCAPFRLPRGIALEKICKAVYSCFALLHCRADLSNLFFARHTLCLSRILKAR